jgi:lipoprotein-releasing system permease protein
MKKNHPINTEIAFTYISTNKRLTAVAALGVLLGIAVFIFMNSMMEGFDRSTSAAIFKSIAHIRIYKDDEVSKPLTENPASTSLIINPKVIPTTNTIINPKMVVALMESQEDVTVVTPQVTSSVFYNNGKSQIAGTAIGFPPEAGNRMFNIKSFMVEGDFDRLKNNPNGIVIGSGIAKKMNIATGDNISLTSSKDVTKVMKVEGIFQTKNSREDKTKSYLNLQAAQQLLKQGNSYITDINVNVKDFNKAELYAGKFTRLTGYKAEDWKAANETLIAGSKMRKVIITFVSFTILLVAGFGIYNILNMTVSQKINDIAILKAIGFKGNDVIKIFVTQAIFVGLLGIVAGSFAAAGMVFGLQNYYVGGDIGYFPISFEPIAFAKGIGFGFIVTFLAGYMPARKAAKVDPVSIFRK